MSFVPEIDRAWTLVESLRRDAFLFGDRMPGQLAAHIEALGAMLDEGGILDAATLVLDDDLDAPPVQVDTREQDPFRPYLWQKGPNGKYGKVFLEAERVALAEGDYTSPAVAAHVRIERKSIPDLYGSLYGGKVSESSGEMLTNQERLRREFARLGAYARRYLVIEGYGSDLAEYIIAQRRMVNPVAAIQLVESLGFDYGVEVRWCGATRKMTAREHAEWFVGYILARAHAQATKRAEARKAARRGLVLPWAWKEAGNG